MQRQVKCHPSYPISDRCDG